MFQSVNWMPRDPNCSSDECLFSWVHALTCKNITWTVWFPSVVLCESDQRWLGKQVKRNPGFVTGKKGPHSQTSKYPDSFQEFRKFKTSAQRKARGREGCSVPRLLPLSPAWIPSTFYAVNICWSWPTPFRTKRRKWLCTVWGSSYWLNSVSVNLSRSFALFFGNRTPHLPAKVALGQEITGAADASREVCKKPNSSSQVYTFHFPSSCLATPNTLLTWPPV